MWSKANTALHYVIARGRVSALESRTHEFSCTVINENI